MGPHISLAAERIGEVFGWPVTNSILMTWLVMAVLIVFGFLAARGISLVPNTIQSIAEMVIDALYNLFSSVVGKDKIDSFFPLLCTIFLFVLISNWFGLLPGVGSITIAGEEKSKSHSLIKSAFADTLPNNEITAIEESGSGEQKPEIDKENSTFVPLFRGPTADLNTTLALALVAVFSLQYFGLKTLRLGYIKKFINFSNPINFFLGLLEIISELAKVVSFAFRLFGNIFAGEVLLTVIAFLMPIIAPLPFIGLELFVGVIQALVFSMLTAVFLNMATTSHEQASAHAH